MCAFWNVQVIQQSGHIGHHIDAILLRIVRFIAPSMAAIVNRNHLITICKATDNTWFCPVRGDIEGEPVDQDHGFALAFYDVVDSHTSGVKEEILPSEAT